MGTELGRGPFLDTLYSAPWHHWRLGRPEVEAVKEDTFP